MFIRIKDIIVNTDNITTINEDDNEDENGKRLRINFINGNKITFPNISLDKVERLLNKIDREEDKLKRLEILDL